MPIDYDIDLDTWGLSPQKLPPAAKITLGPIHGVLPFDGVRNPGSRSATSHHAWFTYQTEADNWQPRVGICESAAEFAVALETLRDPDVYDIKFQPLEVDWAVPGSKKRPSYTHDFLIVMRNGFRRLVFVRNSESLSKESVWRRIDVIAAATKPRKFADDMIVVDAASFSRQRRENLFRMWQFCKTPDVEADEIVLNTAKKLKTMWHMKDLFPVVPITQKRAFHACYRLVSKKQLQANLDNVLWENSRIWVGA